MKKKLAALILTGVIAFSLAGCKGEPDQGEVYSRDFEAGVQSVTVQDLTYSVPKVWETSDGKNGFTYYYPGASTDSYLSVSFNEMKFENYQITEWKNFNVYIDGMESSGYKNANKEIKQNKNQIEYAHHTGELSIESDVYDVEAALFNCDGGFVSITFMSKKDFGINYTQDINSIFDSVEVSKKPAQETIAIDSNNPFLLADFSTDTVYSGSGKDIGTYGYIEVEKSSLPALFTDEFFDYFTEFADTKVKDSGYNWVSIILDDGTGFCFTGSNTIFVDYGSMDDEGCIATQFGICRRLTDAGGYKCVRFIPNPTILQEAMAPDNEFNPVEEIIFNTFASENGLGDTPFYVEGTIEDLFDFKGYNNFLLSTAYGDLYIGEVLVPFPEIEIGSHVTIFFIYGGWADAFNGPSGSYVYLE